MKAVVDQETCIGCELCTNICPEVFSMGEDGKSHAIPNEIPDALTNDAQEARDSCPVSAISIEE